MKNTFLLLISIILFYGCIIKNENHCPNCGCDNVDDCLSKYKFQESRTYASYSNGSGYSGDISKNQYLAKIIETEANYWISQKELEKAQEISKELLSLKSSEYYDIKERDLIKLFCQINIDIIHKYTVTKKYDEANNIVIQLPEKIIYNTGTFFTEVDFKKYKNRLERDQGVEPSHHGGYNIVTYSYPRKEAIKIIEEYKKKSK